MNVRSLEPEIMDVRRPPRTLVEQTYRFIGVINRWLGGLRATRHAFAEFARGWRADERIRVLDVASGTGDIPRELAKWDARLEFVCSDIDRVARRGLVMNDLVRRRRLYWWTKFFTLFGNEIVRHDGPLSVRKSFTVAEMRALAAPLAYLRVRTSFGHRAIIYGEKANGGPGTVE